MTTTRKPTDATTRLTIAGHVFHLRPGRTYLAGRDMATRWMETFDVTIHDVTDGRPGRAVAVVENLGYDAANALLAAFNDGESSFAGRTI
jgi:hypothetical protein